MKKLIIIIAALVPTLQRGNARLKLIIAVTLSLTALSTVYSQNSLLQVNNSPTSNFMSRFAVEAGVNISYPIQNFAESNTSGSFNFTGSIYAKIVNKVSIYFNYCYINNDWIMKLNNRGEYVNDYYVPLGDIKSYNIGGNYSFEYKEHIPFIEGGIGLYTFHEGGSDISKTSFGANLGAGYRFQFDKHLGLFVKGKLHTFSYDSKYWSLWNLSGGVFVKL
jgi:hypothetical protein